MSSSSARPHAPVRTVIIEDSENIRELVARRLHRHFAGRINVVGEGFDVDDSVALIRQLKPQLVLLDIELMTGTGFDVLDILGEERKTFAVVFITNFDKYLRETIDYGAVGFIDKPILTDNFKKGIEQGIRSILDREEAEQRLTEQIQARLEEQFKNGILPVQHTEEAPASITIRFADGKGQATQTVLIREITHCVALDGYTVIHRKNQSSLTDAKPLKQYHQKLAAHGFMRISRSLVIHPAHCRLEQWGAQDATVRLPDGTEHEAEGIYKKNVLLYLRSLKE
jgi:two-component system LytT family response regulator